MTWKQLLYVTVGAAVLTVAGSLLGVPSSTITLSCVVWGLYVGLEV